MRSQFLFLACISSTVFGCGQRTKRYEAKPITSPASEKGIINERGNSIETRFNTPEGFERMPADPNSFAYYLRRLPLKVPGAKVKYYYGGTKDKDVYDAVVDMEITNKDLQQCADAVMRLRGEYFYAIKQYDNISFRLENGFKMNYTEWMNGNRIALKGDNTSWYKATAPSNTHKDFRNYMDFVFTYAGTPALSKTLHSKNIKDIAIGDVFIVGGSPGHAVIVVDVAENSKGKVFMLAQSYMPAQETQILKNPDDSKLSPWYSGNIKGQLETPEWTFTTDQLKSWRAMMTAY